MKLIKQIAFGAMLTISAFCAVVYSSCNKDKCKDVSCDNSGVCSGGNCTCPIGVTGTNCETVYRADYAHTYRGNGTYSDASGAGLLNGYHLVFTAGSDTTYYKMSMLLTDSTNGSVVTLPVILSNFGTTGSVMTIVSTTANVNGVNNVYTGTGTISSTLASMVITETPVAGGGSTIYTFTNFAKQ